MALGKTYKGKTYKSIVFSPCVEVGLHAKPPEPPKLKMKRVEHMHVSRTLHEWVYTNADKRNVMKITTPSIVFASSVDVSIDPNAKPDEIATVIAHLMELIILRA